MIKNSKEKYLFAGLPYLVYVVLEFGYFLFRTIGDGYNLFTVNLIIFLVMLTVVGVGMFFHEKFPVSAIGFGGLTLYYVWLLIETFSVRYDMGYYLVIRALLFAVYASAIVITLSKPLKIDKFCSKIWFIPGALYGLEQVIWLVRMLAAGYFNIVMLYDIFEAVILCAGLLISMMVITSASAQPEVKANPYGYNQYGQNPYGAYNQPNNGYGAYNQPNSGYNNYNNYNGYNNAPIEEEEATQIEGYDAPRTFDREAEIRKYRSMLEAGYISVEEYNARIRQINGFNR